MPRVHWFCTSLYPDLPYTGFFALDGREEYLRSLYLIRAGQIYRAVSLPEHTPNSCYGTQVHKRWGIPAIYRKRGDGSWTGLTSGCEFRVIPGPLPYTHRFFFTHEPDASGRTRLHIHVKGESQPLHWKRISRTELEIDMCFNTP
jgi:hypothetical protein